ncbi:MAG: 50S ribosomal protein L1 [Planctomycetes bacterium]|nr:50S ribosomal protein L1 [Planctomycetota bacterium]
MPVRHGKRYRNDVKNVVENQTLPLPEAVAKLKTFKATKFDMSVDLCVHLGVDPKHADQLVRGSISLPHGTGKSKRVVCFCGADKVEAAKKAGAIEAGGEELAKRVEEGWMDFDVAVASPDTMRYVGKLGKVLGPKGLMPSPKAGTVTADVEKAVREYAAGKIEFRTDKGGNVHAPVGKFSFSEQQIAENAQAMLDTIVRMKPSSVKGQYIKKISLSGTMTPGVLITNVS